MKDKIIIVSGEPNSINSEIIYKSWKKLNKNLKKKIYLVSNYNLIKRQFLTLNYSTNLKKMKNLNDDNSSAIKIFDISLNFNKSFKVNHKNSTEFIKKSLKFAHNLAVSNKVKGIINCPINKLIFKPKKIGVTEYLASISKIKKDTEVMLIANENFSVCPITTHIDIKDVSKNLNREKIIKKVKVINSWFYKQKKRKPKIGILGLNPHNAEMRNNSEELKHIIPAIKYLKKLNISIKGPLVSDTIFIKDYKNFDILIGMYHDQVLTPFKTLYGFNAINLTLGLKYPRLSPDHGVAFKLIRKNKADASSLLKCITFLNNLKL